MNLVKKQNRLNEIEFNNYCYFTKKNFTVMGYEILMNSKKNNN